MKEIPLSLSQYNAAGPQRMITPSEFAAVDALCAAFNALNAAQSNLDEDSPLARDTPTYPEVTSPMGYVALAARSALTLLCERVGMTTSDADEIWHTMLDGGESARDVYVAVRFSNY